MSATEVMDPNPSVMHLDDKISAAADCVMENRYRNVPVVDDEGRFVGIFGVNCLLKLTLPKAAIMHKGLDKLTFIHESLYHLLERFNEIKDLPVSTCIEDHVVTVPPDHPLLETLLLLYRNKSSIPVVDPETKKLLGMISYWDVGRHILSAQKQDDD